MMTSSDQTQMELTSGQAQNLRDVLLKCEYMKTPEKRRVVRSALMKDRPGILFETNADPQIDISETIDRCVEFGGAECLELFLNCLEGFETKVSNRMEAVWAVWNEIVGPPQVPDRLRTGQSSEGGFIVRPVTAKRPARPDELSRVGGELHWDRDLWVEDFMDIVLAKPGKEDIRVLAIPAPPEADPDRFVQYLEVKCNELCRSTGMGTPIVSVRLQLTDPLLPYQIVVRVLSLLASKSELCREDLRSACERIRKEWEPREVRPQLSLSSLAEKFSLYLREAAKTCRPVILLHGFVESISEPLRSWLLYTWLESYQFELQGTVAVLAGSPSLGLEGLRQPPHMVCFHPLPEMDSKDLWEWAYYGHGLTWLPLELVTKHNKDHIHGSASKFYDFILTCKTIEQFIPQEKLLEWLSEHLESQR